ncbi:TRAP transporter large permease [Alloalcanivorax xenomutans]|jgi:C4-dicarboxylate transporter, DctM subunit|uniref:TRAP transporter large permease protein n=1 Tax=Alloalcanivorax xenomutans TaxID=1094342 RepID=A0A9Q3W7S3_9GAMM|nr:TRAP transporter large permease subunit [Alloalcanivorax xenomutans]KYZ87477.1 C4-dicarboxylate ABC transporter [Alcanivorax sp. KX64203]ARB46650.1 C4-dicarboxylate ABC transporter [Alloalcanivorax xenomutans]MCE7510594.1 TRAP transporter large permease subunit [Alloalcanivorax xenomutans]MCE7522560.1 TRAP transporter large permease subunit [Alloalcanivorax xenomutans]WOA30391.1 TRAP transporter large permease subunit [Alloalcanivorax xenomutans]|tara:strand:- start:89 stop:1378 length:1290 start_codon:yes stop_codon:yes gene_type:complete
MIIAAIVLLIVLALMGAPLFAILLAAAAIGFFTQETPLSVLHIDIYQLSDSVVLMALPLFTFAGFLLSESRTADRLVRLSQAAFGWMPGGMAFVALVACAFFTALTGGSGVTIVALGALLLPALVKAGYPQRFSLGLVTSSGSLGLLLVPSVPLLIYGIIAQQLSQQLTMPPVEIVDLYLAGVGPALLMVVLLYGYCVWVNRADPLPRQPFNARELGQALWDARWELPLPLVVLGGIFSGFLVVSEAAAVTALYVLLAEVVLYREIPLRRLPGLTREAMVMVGGILLILAVAQAFADYLVYAGVPEHLFAFIQTHVQSKLAFLILLNILLLLLGALLDIFAALVIMVPLILPVALRYGIDPVHLGIIFVANMQIGYITPPVGMNLFIASYRFRKSITELFRATLPFMLVLIIALLLITYVPELSLWLVR